MRLNKKVVFNAGYLEAMELTTDKVDFLDVFPRSFLIPEDMRDEYGNLCYELVNAGTPDARFERVEVEPTEEQVSAVRKRRIVQDMQKAGYDRDTEIAIMKKAINAQSKGEPLPNEYLEMENVRQNIKTKVKDDGAVQRSL